MTLSRNETRDKIMSFTWEQRKWTIRVRKWHIWEWWTETPLCYNLL